MAAILVDLILGLFLLGNSGGADSPASSIATGLFWAVLLGAVATRR